MISICIPAYKHVALTHECAQSVLRQDTDLELVVLDDFYLLDQTAENIRQIEALRELLHADRRVKCVSNEKLLPIQDNWNKAVSLCSGSHVKLMGADDNMLPGSVAKMQAMVQAQPAVAFHGHLANLIDAQGKLIRQQKRYGDRFTNRPLTGTEALQGKLRQQVRFKEPACNFFLKCAWEKVGGYDTRFRFVFDVDFNSKLMASSSSMLWNETLVELRRHQNSDGAQLPASLALMDLAGLVEAITQRLGTACTSQDRAAAAGWVQYRLLELLAQRVRSRPLDIAKLLSSNLGLFAKNPASWYWMLKLLAGRALYHDVQQA
ncbi:glycosyltransferase [Rhodoferax lacus]|uniref:glycosyltransferase n=1 Tax=Rhodoferax lacus TaxID=2184758 RepID=UPI001313F1CA|nr:glycosyltransferase [Rhodoferax lacus]